MDFIRNNLPLLIGAVVLIGLWFVFRTSATELESVAAFDRLVSRGEPTVLEFYGNTWIGCLAAKPVVDGIEKDLKGKAKVVRLNLMSRVGGEIADRYAVGSIPTIVVLDDEGIETYRDTGMPDRSAVVTQALAP